MLGNLALREPEKGLTHLPNEGFSERAILIILVEGYFILMYIFYFTFTALLIQLSSLLYQKQVYISHSDF